jgi:hypothetical protein
MRRASFGGFGRNTMIARLLSLTLAFAASVAVARSEAACKRLSDAGYESGIQIPGSDAIREVVGTGRLAFHSAPSGDCVMPGIFVVPRDKLVAYVEYKGYTAVLYVGGEEPVGWVLSSRLRATGTGISPKQ